MSEKRNILKAAGVLGGATVLSRIMGMVRDMVVSRLFGAGLATDAFFAAFQIPNMLRRFFAEGALTSAFVPTFSSVLTQRGENQARELANTCFTLLTIIISLITLAGIYCSPWIVGLMFPGFKSVPGKYELTILLNQIMFPYLFFISLVALCMGILNTLRHFFTPAVSTVFLNLSMIIAALTLHSFFAVPITALAVGVLIGGVIQLILQMPVLWKMGFKPAWNFNFSNPDVRKISILMLPSVFGVGVYYLNITASAILASLLPEGSVSYLYYAQRLFEFPQGIFTVSVAQAVLPSMSKQAAEHDLGGMKESLTFGLRLTLFVTVPAMAGLVACSTPIFSLLFMGGAFDYSKAAACSTALVYYSLGLSFVALTRVLAPAFYALGDTRTPVITAFISFVLNLCFSLALMGPLRHGGLALATTLSACCNMLMLFWFLRRKLGLLGGGHVLLTGCKSLLVSIPMAAATWYICTFSDWSLSGHKFEKSVILALAIVAALIIYAAGMRLMRSEELHEVATILKRKRRPSC